MTVSLPMPGALPTAATTEPLSTGAAASATATTAEKPARGRLARAGYTVVSIPLAIAVFAVLAHFFLHIGAVDILSGSMRPTFAPGDVIVTREVPVSQLRVGDVVVLTPPGESAPVAHRIVEIDQWNSSLVLRTKGDANPARDAWKAVLTTRTLPVEMTVLPHLGRISMYLRSQLLRSLLVLLFGALMTGALVRKLLTRSGCPAGCTHHDSGTTAAPATESESHS